MKTKDIGIKVPELNKIELKNEWDKQEIGSHFSKEKIAIVRATLPGSGKTESCIYLTEMGYKVLVICPTNALMIDFIEKGIPCTTYDQFC